MFVIVHDVIFSYGKVFKEVQLTPEFKDFSEAERVLRFFGGMYPNAKIVEV